MTPLGLISCRHVKENVLSDVIQYLFHQKNIISHAIEDSDSKTLEGYGKSPKQV